MVDHGELDGTTGAAITIFRLILWYELLASEVRCLDLLLCLRDPVAMKQIVN